MAFVAKPWHTESLQTLAMALRQEEGNDIRPDQISPYMRDLGSLPQNIRQYCYIDYAQRTSDFRNWLADGDPSAVNEWLNSCAWIANELYPRYCRKGKYNFYRQDLFPAYKGTYNRIKNDIKNNSNQKLMKKIYKIGSINEDKWNPSDIIAVEASQANSLSRRLDNFQASQVSKMSQEIQSQNERMNLNSSQRKEIHLMEDLDEMYEYNKLIDDLFVKLECIGISLKKAASSNFPIRVMRHKDTKGIKKALNMKIEITGVQYLSTNQKCIVDFTISGERGHYLDIRGFESSRKISDVQIQLSKTGSTSAHGKITLPIVTLITKLSKGRASLSKMNAEKRKLFGSNKVGSKHGFTDWEVFNNYTIVRGRRNGHLDFQRDKDNWTKYIQWLSKNRHESVTVMQRVERELGPRGDQYFKAAKYLKHKVQSYEVGFLLDKEQKQIKDEIKVNIIKSMYSYAGSKGLVVFNDDKATAFMVSSTYLKAGG